MKDVQIFKGGVIKIPPLVFNEVKTYRVIVILFFGILFQAGKDSRVDVRNMPNKGGVIPLIISADSINSEYTTDIKPIKIVQEAENEPVRVNKKIAITEIVKDPKILDYICHNEVLKRAIQASDETGLSIALVIAQKGVESNWGQSSLTKKTNNEGNIKCKCSFNKKLRKKHEKMDVCKRGYDKIEKSNHWYVKLKTKWEGMAFYKNLINRSYKKVRNMDSYEDQIRYMKKKGYATMDGYDKIIIKVIKNNKLDELEKYVNMGYIITTTNGAYNLN